MISGWKTRYLSILKELKYSEKKDKESAIILDSILRKTKNIEKVEKLIQGNTVFVIGSGPSLSFAIPKLKKFKKFRILKTIAAGDNPKIKKVPKYSAIEVMTGAIIQKPYDAVIPIEQIKFNNKKNKFSYIIVDRKVNKNDYIRFEGSDFKKREKVINRGELIKPQHILALKTLGINKILVIK